MYNEEFLLILTNLICCNSIFNQKNMYLLSDVSCLGITSNASNNEFGFNSLNLPNLEVNANNNFLNKYFYEHFLIHITIK